MVRTLWLALAVGCAAGDDDDVVLDAAPDTSTGEDDSCLGADPFVIGIAETSPAGRTVRITAAAPTPPDVGDNTWTLEITDDAGPVTGLSPSLVPWMPLHGHGLVPTTYVGTEEEGTGRYALETFDLVMPGLWEFRLALAAEPADEVIFQFCAEG